MYGQTCELGLLCSDNAPAYMHACCLGTTVLELELVQAKAQLIIINAVLSQPEQIMQLDSKSGLLLLRYAIEAVSRLDLQSASSCESGTLSVCHPRLLAGPVNLMKEVVKHSIGQRA